MSTKRSASQQARWGVEEREEARLNELRSSPKSLSPLESQERDRLEAEALRGSGDNRARRESRTAAERYRQRQGS